MKFLKRFWLSILIVLLEIAMGIMLIADANQLTVFVFTLFGIALLVLSLVMTIQYLKARKKETASIFTLITAITAFVFGVVLTFGAAMLVDLLSKLLAIFYGAIMIVNGGLKIGEFFALKKQKAAASPFHIISGILSIVLGVIAIIFNYLALETIGIIIGITLIVVALFDIAALVNAHRMTKDHDFYEISDAEETDDDEEE